MDISVHSMVGFLGRLHPAVVHFPIALLAVAALVEGIQVWRRSSVPSPATPFLSIVAALGGMAASGMGLFLKIYEETEGSLVALHGWLGLGATVLAVVASLSFLRGARRPWAVRCGRIALAAGAMVVFGAGFLGGEMVFGQNHLFEVFEAKASILPPGKEPEFERDIAPILKSSCLKCHGSAKQKGHLRLDREEDAFRGGENGPAIVRGDRRRSLLFALLVEKDAGSRMPQKGDPLTPAEIELIGRWIDRGAPWPKGKVVE